MSEFFLDLPATSYPNEVQEILRLNDISFSVLPKAQHYQELMNSGNVVDAIAYLDANEDLKRTMLTPSYINSVIDTLTALQRVVSLNIKNIIVSKTEPIGETLQADGCFWYEISDDETYMVIKQKVNGVYVEILPFKLKGISEKVINILDVPVPLRWVSRTSGITDGLCSVTYNGNLFVTVGNGGKILTSTDGITWVSRTSGITDGLWSVTYNGNLFVTVGYRGKILTSTDGITWVSRTSGITDILFSVTYNENLFVTVGDGGKILTSTDGITWVSRTSGIPDSLFSVTYNGNIFVTVGSGGKILTSTDGITWVSRTSGITDGLWSVTYNGNLFVTVGSGGKILTSTDGITWVSRTSGIATKLWSVIYNENLFVTVGDGGKILTSTDGITWVSRTSGIPDSLFSVTYNGNIFVTVGNYGRILTSATEDLQSNGDLVAYANSANPISLANLVKVFPNTGNFTLQAVNSSWTNENIKTAKNVKVFISSPTVGSFSGDVNIVGWSHVGVYANNTSIAMILSVDKTLGKISVEVTTDPALYVSKIIIM